MNVRPASKQRADAAARLVMLAVALAGFSSSGCRMISRRVASAEPPAGSFDQAHLVYQIDAGRLNVPLELTRIESQLVSYDHQATTPLPDQAVGKLTIDYPHPERHAGFAQVRLEISSADDAAALEAAAARGWRAWSKKAKGMVTSPPPSGAHETWVIDIPRMELDQIVAQLTEQGYFEEDRAGLEGVELDAELDKRKLAKRWRQVPQLDALMLRTRGDGRLVAYQRPKAGPTSPPSAVLAYQQWQDSMQAPPVAAPTTLPVAPQAAAPAYVALPGAAPAPAYAPPASAAPTYVASVPPQYALPPQPAAWPPGQAEPVSGTPVPTVGPNGVRR